MPRLRKLFLSPSAAEDLEIVTEPLRSEIIERLRFLRQFPHIGPRLHGKLQGFRATTVGIFRIIYRIHSRGVEVIYVRHCKRHTPGPPRANSD